MGSITADQGSERIGTPVNQDAWKHPHFQRVDEGRTEAAEATLARSQDVQAGLAVPSVGDSGVRSTCCYSSEGPVVMEERAALEPKGTGPCHSLEQNFSFLKLQNEESPINPQWVVTKMKIH